MDLIHLGEKDIEMKEEKKKEKETEDFFHSNELIIKLFINKLIIWSVRKQHISELEQQMNSFICSYIEENVRNTISLNFIAYEEEENIDEMNESTIQNKNTWVELQEPSVSRFDAYASTLIKSGSMRDGLGATNRVIKEDSKGESRYTFDSINEKIKSSRDHTRNVTSNVNKEVPMPKRKEKIEKTIEPSYDILGYNDVDNNPEIILLRKQKQMEIQKLADDLKKQQSAEEQEKIAAAYSKMPAKLFDGSKFTFDSNGEVLVKKSVQGDYLPKEFYWMKYDIKNLEVKSGEIDKSKKKNNAARETVVIYNPNIAEAFGLNNPRQNEKKDVRGIPSGSNFDIILPEIGVRITENKKIKGGEKEFSTKYKRMSNQDYETMLNESIPQLNASLMKTKFSNTMLNVYNTSSNLDNSEYIPFTEANRSLDKSTYLNHSNQNPLLASQDDRRNRNNAYGIGIYNRSGINKDLSNFNMTNNFTTSRMLTEEDMVMKMNKKYKSSLKIAMDSINDLGMYSGNSSMLNFNENNIFKTLAYKPMVNKPNQGEDENIKYNKTILKSKDWGGTDYKTPVNKSLNNQTFRKPNQLSLIRELGLNIINTKVPRSRKYNHDLHIKK